MSEHKETILLKFYGPYTFTAGSSYLFKSEFAKSEGIYIWTIKDEQHQQNLVHYIGETICFGKRQREHLIQITGLNYRIIDPTMARKGVERIVWDGLWRDRTPEAVARLLDSYEVVSRIVPNYIGLINIYFAPTTLEKHLRRHIEGCIGWNLRKNHPHLKTFYPDDNNVGRQKNLLGLRLMISSPEVIAGIEQEMVI